MSSLGQGGSGEACNITFEAMHNHNTHQAFNSCASWEHHGVGMVVLAFCFSTNPDEERLCHLAITLAELCRVHPGDSLVNARGDARLPMETPTACVVSREPLPMRLLVGRCVFVVAVADAVVAVDVVVVVVVFVVVLSLLLLLWFLLLLLWFLFLLYRAPISMDSVCDVFHGLPVQWLCGLRLFFVWHPWDCWRSPRNST
jgi:hypothetical protein